MASRRWTLAATGLALAAAGAAYVLWLRQDRPKNVILITLDGVRQDHLSFNGHSRTTSPNIDWLVERGRVLDTVISTASSTKGSLTSLLTSSEFASHGLVGHEDHLPRELRTLAEAFTAGGYRSAGFVATPNLMRSMEYDRGFEHYEDFMSRRLDYVRAGTVIDAALDWLQGVARDDKYFMYVHLEEPHSPWYRECPWCDAGNPEKPLSDCTTIPPDALFNDQLRLREKYLQEYDGAIWYADQQIGRLLEAVRSRKELDDTIIAVSTDHGYELLDRYHIGHGRSPFDEVVKLFVVLYGDGTGRSSRQASMVDVGPTLLGSAGIPAPAEFEGRDLLREGFAEDPLAFTQGYGVISARTNRYKLVEIAWPADIPQPAYVKAYGFQLFDLQKDPGERVDVQAQQPREFELLRKELVDYTRRLMATTKRTKVIDKDLDRETMDRLRALGYIK